MNRRLISVGLSVASVFASVPQFASAQLSTSPTGGGISSTPGIGGAGGVTGGMTGGMTGGTAGGLTGGLGGTGTGGAGMSTSNYPGTFGGPGVTGQMILQNLNTQPITAAGGAGGSAFGTGVSGSAFGSNAFSGGASTQGGMNAGGMNMGGMGMGGMGLGGVGGLGRGGMGLGGFGAGNFGMGMMGGNAQGRKPIRASVRPEIEMSARGAADLSARTTSRFTNLPAAQKFPNVNASYENGSVVLRGSVATEKDKKMMERLMKLEPGVDSVRNELLVQGPTLEQIPALRN